MPRYIDANALYDNISDLFVEYLAVTSNNEARNIVKSLYKVILDDLVDNAPTVSPDEVRGVVHCKECKHTERDGTDDPAIYCKVWDRWEMPEDGFCYKGAKMEVEGDA